MMSITERKLVGPSMSEICCLDGQVYDNGNCADTCPSERPMDTGGVCECEANKNDLGGGLCCADGEYNYDGFCEDSCGPQREPNDDTDTCECPPGKANLNGVCCPENQKMKDGGCVDSCQDVGKMEVEGLCGK